MNYPTSNRERAIDEQEVRMQMEIDRQKEESNEGYAPVIEDTEMTEEEMAYAAEHNLF